jgi:hypothetical protein
VALSLNDIQKKKTIKKVDKDENKSRVLRPWESFEQRGNQTRTIGAQEAVIKARKIVENNNTMVENLREGFVGKETDQRLNKNLENRSKEFEFDNIDLNANIHKIKTNNGLLGRIREIFGS